MKESNIWVNGGYFVLRKDVFRYMKPGEELVYEPLQRMIAEGKVWSQRYEGFWQCMDTFKDKQILDELEASGKAPWCRVEERTCSGRCCMMKLSLPRKARAIHSRSSALARTLTISRSVAEGPCCSSRRAPR